MPSQRLLKILDPVGHAGHAHLPVLVSRVPNAVVWAAAANRGAIAAALAASRVTPLVAMSFRHISSSLHPTARPRVALAVIDFDIVTDEDISALVTRRWAGYRGTVIGLSKSGLIEHRTRTLAGVEAVLRPGSDALRELVAGYMKAGRLG